MKVSDSLDNVPNENVVTQQVTNQPTDRLSDQLLELLEWLFATSYVKLTQEEQTAGTSNGQIPCGIVEACIPEIFSSIP